MRISTEKVSSALTRRHFALWMTASGLSACGGGGGEGAPAPAPPPGPAPGPASLSLMAGALGGSGFLPGVLTDARLPPVMAGHAFNSKGDLWFVGRYGREQKVGRITAEGRLSYFAFNQQMPVTLGVVDARDRYVIAHAALDDSGTVVSFFDNETLVTLAGQPNATTMQDGKGPAAQILWFGNPLLAGDGLVYFLDRDAGAANYTLRTLAPDGTVVSLLPVPNNSRLIASPTGAVRRFTDDFQNNRVQWAELARASSGQYFWEVLPNNWRSVAHAEPFAPVKGSIDMYWGFDAAFNTMAHYALDGTRTDVWQLPGRVDAAVSNPLTGHLVAHAWRGPLDQSSLESPGVLLVLDRVKTPTAVPQPWVGLADQRGHTDGQGDAARFDFERGARATSEASGPLYVAVGAQIPLPGTPPQSVPTPLRTVTPAGQVTSMPVTYPWGYQLLSSAYGYLLAYDKENQTLLRAPKAGSTAWEPWVRSEYFGANPGFSGMCVLRADTTGLLWFATRTLPITLDWLPPGSGTSLIGTISATGQVQVVVGDPQLVHTAANYPPLDQRPWYMDVTDMAFEGGSSPISWVLCNRAILSPDRKLLGYAPELVRLEGATRQSFALPSANETDYASMHYNQLCVVSGRPGEVFLCSACGVYRWTVAKGLELLAGQNQPTPAGVRLGALPTSLNVVKFISPGPDAHSLYVGSENSVLRLGLPG